MLAVIAVNGLRLLRARWRTAAVVLVLAYVASGFYFVGTKDEVRASRDPIVQNFIQSEMETGDG